MLSAAGNGSPAFTAMKALSDRKAKHSHPAVYECLKPGLVWARESPGFPVHAFRGRQWFTSVHRHEGAVVQHGAEDPAVHHAVERHCLAAGGQGVGVAALKRARIAQIRIKTGRNPGSAATNPREQLEA